MGKKFGTFNIDARTLIFGIDTGNRLFLKSDAGIFVILIFLASVARQSGQKAKNWQKSAIFDFQTPKMGRKIIVTKIPASLF